MAFCNFSSDMISKNTTNIDNAFFSEFLPNATEGCVKVYLYGLYKCNNPLSVDNSLEGFSQVLNMSEDDIMSCFYYWQELNLVKVISTNPFEVRYLPIKSGNIKLKKYNPDKYSAFNLKAQELIAKRMITPKEYDEYYYLIESMHLSTEALLKIMEYAVQLKGDNVGYSYIITLAKNWAYEGILTLEKVNERLDEQVKNTSKVVDILHVLGIKRNPTIDEYQMFLNWTGSMEFPLDSIVYLASKQGKNKGGMNKLNETILKCYSLKKESIKEIDAFYNQQQEMYDIAKRVCKNLGIFYNSMDNVVDTYIVNWYNLGYDGDALNTISNYCFRMSIKTLQGMDTRINQFFKLGLLTTNDIENYIAQLLKGDDELQNILHLLKIERQVSATDRQLLKTWKYDWNLSSNIIKYVAELSSDKYMPMQYLNKTLSALHTHNITSLEKAKEFVSSLPNESIKNHNKSNKKFTEREYTNKELSSLFVDIKEVEI